MFNFERFRCYMSLKNYFVLLIILLQCLIGNAQITESKTFTLSWNDQNYIQISKEKSIVLPLIEGNFFDENNIPTSTHVFNVQNNVIVQQFKIKNVKFSPINVSLLKNIETLAIPTEISSEFQLTKVKNKSIAVLKLKALVKNNKPKYEPIILPKSIFSGVAANCMIVYT